MPRSTSHQAFVRFSGETGAGKSILIDALGLVLGSRADAAMVREGARQTEISASFSPSPKVLAWLREHELDATDEASGHHNTPGELHLRRLVMADGRSKAFINGSPVTATQLRELGGQLIEIHGQHAAQSLLSTEGQRGLLDDFAQAGSLASELRSAWDQWRSAQRLLERASSEQGELVAERDELQWQLGQIEAIGPKPDEWQQLSAEQTRLANGVDLVTSARTTVAALTDDEESISDRIGQLLSRLRQRARLDPALDPALDLLESAQIQLVEAASELGSYAERLDLDPSRLADVDARVSAMFELARKLRCEPDELPARAVTIGERLVALQGAQDIAQLQRQVQAAGERYAKAAQALSLARRTAATTLAKAVNGQLAGLGMAAARFEIVIEAGEPAAFGVDQIEFRFAGHESLGPRPLGRVASGGELSRVSLAIAVCAAKANPVDTLIFDEADTGVGGAVADAIGRLMRELGQSRQVLAVTHLPQVAARAHRHLLISRADSAAGGINSRVEQLGDDGRVNEIARMLGGATITATTRQHALELIQLGAQAAPRARPGRRRTA